MAAKAGLALCAAPGKCVVPVPTFACNLLCASGARRSLRRLAALAAWIWCACTAGAAPSLLRLPAIDGEFSGDYLAPQSGLAFHWHIAVESPSDTPRIRRARLAADGHGAHVVALATHDLVSGVTHWEIENAHADLAETFPVLAARFLPDFASLMISGKLSLTGGGDVSAAGEFSGRAVAEIRDASVRDDARGWSAEGITTRIELPSLPALKTAGAESQPISIRRFTHEASGVALEDVRTSVALDEGMRVRFTSATARALGGAVSLDGFDIDSHAPNLTTVVHVDDIESAQLAKFLPDAISEVHGRFAGALTLHWTPATGVKLGNGKLTLQKAAGSTLRLAPSPGFFTSNMDSRLYVLPPSWGFLRRLISIKNPAYDTLKQIENGEQPIAVESIAINFTPEGDTAGRSASVIIAARPTNPQSAIKKLSINVNVNGPLVKVLEMSTAGNLKISF